MRWGEDLGNVPIILVRERRAGMSQMGLAFFRAFRDSKDLWSRACVFCGAMEFVSGGGANASDQKMVATEAALLEIRVRADEKIPVEEKALIFRESGLAKLNPRLSNAVHL